MAKIFTIKGKYRTSNDIIDNISKYIDINKLNNIKDLGIVIDACAAPGGKSTQLS